MRKTLLIILAIAISMTVLSNSLNAATSEQDATQPDFLESTAMAELQTAAEDECEHDFKEWSYRSTSDIDGTKYHHRECKKCGYIECGLHENRYGGCSICDYGIFDFSTVNFSDTFGMTSTELRKYMSDIFGETNIYDDSLGSSNYFEVNRGDFLNLRIYAGKPDFGETKIPDFVECLRIHMNIWDPTEEQLNGCFYLMDGIKMGDTRGHMLSEAEARGYKVKTKDKAFDEKLVTIDDGKSIFEFKYYAHKNEDGSYDDDPNEYVEECYLFACRDCYGGSHPQHDLSDISIDGILGMEVDEGTARLKEAFGEECVEVSDSDRVIVDRREVPGYCDFVFLQFYAKKVGSKYIFNSISAGGFSDHVDMKPNIISDMPNTMTVQEINKLAEEMGATIYEQDDTLYFQDVPEGSKTIIYNFKLDKYSVEYRVRNYRTIFEAQYRGGYELIPDDEWQDTLAVIVDVDLLDSALPITPADANSDGEITLDDAVLTLQRAMNVGITGSVFNESAADVNSDGEITLDDAIEILKRAMNINS